MSNPASKEMLAELVAEHARAWRDWAYAHSSQTYDPGTKYKEEEAEEVSKQLIAAFDARQPVETNAGIPCVHCRETGDEQQVYDSETGWSDEKPCDTCGGTGRIRTVEQYLKTLPADWHKDSSLGTWFPLTSKHYNRLCNSETEPAQCPVIDGPCRPFGGDGQGKGICIHCRNPVNGKGDQ